MLGLLKKLKWVTLEQSDLIVFDNVGADVFRDHVFPGRSIPSIDSRNESFVVNFKIIYLTIVNIVSLLLCRFTIPISVQERLKTAYYVAIVKSYRPAIVVTFIDTNPYFSILSEYITDVEFCAFENGFRLPYTSTLRPYSMSHFFCYGQSDVEAFKKPPHHIKNIYRIGSILGDVARRRFENMRDTTADICIVSQWRDKIMTTDANPEVRDTLFKLYDFVDRISSEHRLRLSIACAVSTESEMEYVKKKFGDRARIVKNNREEMSTYREMMGSKVVVTAWSTAAIEAVGWQKRCLFANFTSERRFDVPVLPEYIITEPDYEKFRLRVLHLLSLDEASFAEDAELMKYQLMSYTEPRANYALIRESFEHAFKTRELKINFGL